MNHSAAKNIVVCADDFGLTEGASQAIVALAECGAITATSCVVDGKFTERYAPALARSANFSIGVHLNLTENNNTPLNAGLKTWLVRSFVLRSNNAATIAREVSRQLDRFETHFGRAPQFVDGHEHVHQFPGVRDALLSQVQTRYGTNIAIRSTVSLASRGTKASIIAALGGFAMRTKLAKAGIATNTDFAGVYDFTTRIPYPELMRTWLQSIAHEGMIMCHPEMPDNSTSPSSRHDEHRFFATSAWTDLQREYQVRLIPFQSSTMGKRK